MEKIYFNYRSEKKLPDWVSYFADIVLSVIALFLVMIIMTPLVVQFINIFKDLL